MSTKTKPIAYGAGTLWMAAPHNELNRRTVDAIKTAIQLGFTEIDGAQMYHTEMELGAAVQESGVPRSAIAVTTKTMDLDDVEASLELSLKKLQMEYVDMYLIHSPFGAKSISHLQSSWSGMERCVKRGLAKKIGVSSFTAAHIDSILETASIKPALNQIEMHPYLQQPELLTYLKKKGIPVQGFAALTSLTKANGGPADAPCKAVADKYGVSPAAVLLRWVIDQGATVVSTSSQEERLAGYLTDLAKFKLNMEDVRRISEASKARYYRGFFAKEFSAFEKGR